MTRSVISVSASPRCCPGSSAPEGGFETGGVRFSAADTAAEIAAWRSAELDREVPLRGGQVPVLRLPWPTEAARQPPPGVRHRGAVAARARRSGPRSNECWPIDGTAEDLFWALYRGDPVTWPRSTCRIASSDAGRTRTASSSSTTARYRGGTGPRNWTGGIPAELLADRPVEERRRAAWRDHLGVAGRSTDRRRSGRVSRR